MGKHHCYAVVIPGLERIAADELAELGAIDPATGEGGITFTATMDALFRIHLRSRISTRILIRLASFSALSFPELYNRCKKVEWQRYIGSETNVMTRAICRHSKLMHSDRAAQALADAVSDRLGRTGPVTGPEQQLQLRIDNNRCTLSIDLSGERLDRRGYRIHAGRAPVRETIAAAILRWIEWQPQEPLSLPMCGSGTFAIEAAWIASGRAAGLERDFAFRHWPLLKRRRWQRAITKAKAMQQQTSLTIHASDLESTILDQARANAHKAGVYDSIRFDQADIFTLHSPARSGLLICNPPYGDRIRTDAPALYRSIGNHLRRAFAGWRVAILAPDRGCLQAFGGSIDDQLKIRHGGKWIYVAAINLPPRTGDRAQDQMIRQ